jgi:hypothetical protein
MKEIKAPLSHKRKRNFHRVESGNLRRLGMARKPITPKDKARGARILAIMQRVNPGDRKAFGRRFDPPVTVQAVGCWLRGENEPKGANLDMLCALGDVPADWILRGGGGGLKKETPIAPGFRQDAARYTDENETGAIQSIVAGIVRERANAHAWVMKSDVLTLAGVRPGDVLIFESGLEARDGDIVRAQVENESGGADTVVRLFRPPNLIGAGVDPSAAPIETVDGERVRIAGVMTELFRPR